MSETLSLSINGKAHALPDSTLPDTPLLDILRNTLGLTGTRFGCGLEQCGACMVLVDGQPVQSCNAALDSVAGKQITTIEGLAGDDGASAATGLSGRAGWPMRLLPLRHSDQRQSLAGPQPQPTSGRYHGSAGWQSLPLRLARADHQGGRAGRGHYAGGGLSHE